jgi:nucleoside-diphosphate-sugar epimerase
MMRWMWTGEFGSVQRHRQEGAAAAAPAFANVALVAGSTGIVGAALLNILRSQFTPGGPWKVYALSRGPLPLGTGAAPAPGEASSNPNPVVVHLDVDLADTAAVAAALAPITDITHVFYTAWSPCLGETPASIRQANCDMLRSVLSAAVPNCPALVHVCLQSGRNHFVDPSADFPASMLPYSEDPPDLENALAEKLDASRESRPDGAAITWSVHRPATIFGFSPRSARNVVASLCVYAAICCKEGVTLRWPGSFVAWHGFSEASDSDLVAEHLLWAALEPSGKNNLFSCTNGDVFKWKQLWPTLAEHFQVEWSGYEGEDKRFELQRAMAGKEAVWAQIVEEKELVETELNRITSWWYVDAVINSEVEQLGTMNKSKEHGFLGFRNTVRSFSAWIVKLKLDRIVP